MTLEQKLRELVERGGMYASTHDLAVLYGRLVLFDTYGSIERARNRGKILAGFW